MKFLNIKSFAFSALFLGLAQTCALGFSLDAFSDFETGEIDQFIELPRRAAQNLQVSSTQSSLDNTVFGGSRTLQLTKLDTVQASSKASLSAFDGIAELASPSYQSRAEIIWDGLDGSGNFQNIELEGGNVQDSFKIDINLLNIGIGDGNLSLNFEIKDTFNNSATITQSFSSNIDSSQAAYFPYSSRVQDTNNTNNVSLANIDYIRFYTSSENIGDDFTFDLVQTAVQPVPFEFTPSLGLIIGGCLFGFLKLQKKLKVDFKNFNFLKI